MRMLLSLALLLATGCACDDADLDGVCDDVDICSGDDASGDGDGDGVCDDNDACTGDDLAGDSDGDGTCDDLDDDDDDDGVDDASDPEPLNASICGDSDSDTCDDCTNGPFDPANDGTDTDGDGACDAGDEDDDDDSVPDDEDVDPLDPSRCEDLDADTCDDCTFGLPDIDNDGTDTDGDGACDLGDEDDDDDGVLDGADSDPLDPFACSDVDADTCDDCSSGSYNPAADGEDWNSDGLCDRIDPKPEGFDTSMDILGKTLTCSSVEATAEYTQCNDAKVDDLYFPNGISCGPMWSTENSRYTDHPSLCEQVTGTRTFEVYYTCDSSRPRITLDGETWGTFSDNGYTQHIRCYFED